VPPLRGRDFPCWPIQRSPRGRFAGGPSSGPVAPTAGPSAMSGEKGLGRRRQRKRNGAEEESDGCIAQVMGPMADPWLQQSRTGNHGPRDRGP